MSQADYRAQMYDNYVSVQAPTWTKQTGKAAARRSAGTLARIHDWLPNDRGAACIDLGCGPGNILTALRDAGYSNIAGVDISPESVAVASAKGFPVILSGLNEYLEQQQRSYDLITAFDVMEHFRKDELLATLKLIRSRMAPGGRFILQVPNACSPWSALYRYGDLTHEWIFATRSLNAVLKLAGFSKTEMHEDPIHVHGPLSAARWLAWKAIWCSYAFVNLVETGSKQDGIYTRNLLCMAVAD